MYSADIDLADDNSSHTQIVRLVGRDRRVLDLGCADGSLGEVLEKHGCTVTGVEWDPASAAEAGGRISEVVTADLETLDLRAQFAGREFDAIVCADVLEHVRDAEGILSAATSLLAPHGAVVASVPNVAHGGVRLSLLCGNWDYQDRGLLDRTHVRFFTRASLQKLLSSAGLVPLELRRTTVGVFEAEVRPDVHAVPVDAVALVESDPDAVTYQFVVKAVPDRPGAELPALLARVRELEAEVERGRAAAAAGDAARADVDQLRESLAQAAADMQAHVAHSRASSEGAAAQRRTLTAELEETRRELSLTQRKLARSEAQRAQAEEILSRRVDERLVRALRRNAALINRLR